MSARAFLYASASPAKESQEEILYGYIKPRTLPNVIARVERDGVGREKYGGQFASQFFEELTMTEMRYHF